MSYGPPSDFASAVAAGLSSRPKQIEPIWLYDDLGSALFEAICALPWYRLTRGERALIERTAGEIGHACADVDFVVELGPGSGEKLSTIVTALPAGPRRIAVHLVDVSRSALSLAARTLTRTGVRDLTSARTDYLAGIDTLPQFRRGRGAALTAFLGSNIGNFHWSDATALLARLRNHLRPGDRILVGADLVKPEVDLLLAYDDPLGVTAAFNRNLLVRINRELRARVDLDAFSHRAVWNAVCSRVEMYLVSQGAQQIDIPGASLIATLAEGETIWTESWYKFRPAQLKSLGDAAGVTLEAQWIDEESLFALALFRV